MKKTFLLLALMCASLMQAQVTVKQSDFVWDTWCLYHDLKTDKYVLHVVSDNQFEDKQIRIDLGTGAKEALQSLENIKSVYHNYGENIDIQGYTFHIEALGYRVLKDSKLQYTAGDYHLMNRDVNKCIRVLSSRVKQ